MSNKKTISQCCYECGVSANVLTCLKRYGNRPKKLAYNTSIYSDGVCHICGEHKPVTETRDFFHPDFSLLKKASIPY